MNQNLDKNGFAALLEALGTDSAEAGAAYEELRVRLIRFFRWNQCQFAEDLADETLDRLAGKLAGSAEPIVSPAGYATGIARMILLEQRAKGLPRKEAAHISCFGFTIGESISRMRNGNVKKRSPIVSTGSHPRTRSSLNAIIRVTRVSASVTARPWRRAGHCHERFAQPGVAPSRPT